MERGHFRLLRGRNRGGALAPGRWLFRSEYARRVHLFLRLRAGPFFGCRGGPPIGFPPGWRRSLWGPSLSERPRAACFARALPWPNSARRRPRLARARRGSDSWRGPSGLCLAKRPRAYWLHGAVRLDRVVGCLWRDQGQRRRLGGSCRARSSSGPIVGPPLAPAARALERLLRALLGSAGGNAARGRRCVSARAGWFWRGPVACPPRRRRVAQV